MDRLKDLLFLIVGVGLLAVVILLGPVWWLLVFTFVFVLIFALGG